PLARRRRGAAGAGGPGRRPGPGGGLPPPAVPRHPGRRRRLRPAGRARGGRGPPADRPSRDPRSPLGRVARTDPGSVYRYPGTFAPCIEILLWAILSSAGPQQAFAFFKARPPTFHEPFPLAG